MSPLGKLESLANFGIAVGDILEDRREQAGHGLLHFVQQVVDDVVEANIDPAVSAARFAATSGRTLKPMMMLRVATAKTDVRFGNRAGARERDAQLHPFVRFVIQLQQRGLDRAERTLNVGLNDDAQFRGRRRLDLDAEIGQLDRPVARRSVSTRRWLRVRQQVPALPARPRRPGTVSPSLRDIQQTQDLDRRTWLGLGERACRGRRTSP